MIDQILTHVDDAKDRLMEQYKGKTFVEGTIETIAGQAQAFEDAAHPLFEGQEIYGAIGIQLDLLGTIVDIGRNGLGDDEYRLLILGKIGQNTSDATSLKVSQVLGVIIDAALVQQQDLYPAAVGFSTSGEIDDALLTLIWNMVQASLGAGIRLEFLSCFDEDEAFAFEGNAGDGLGFDDLTDPGLGGMFGFLCNAEFPFAFASDDPFDGYRGFGSTLDPAAGGNFQSL